jgi:folate-binding protein YgfZ
MPTVIVPDRAVIAVSGPEAGHFLHNVVTADIETLAKGETRPSALLTPQGKILFDFMVVRDAQERFLLDCRKDVAADFIKRLMLYKLRAKIEISEESESVVSVYWDGDSSRLPMRAVSGRDARFARTDVMRAIGPDNTGDSIDAWTALRIAHGVAESGSDYALGDAFPHDVNLDQTGGVSFTKGCYVGQEVVSRMQHRGTARRRVLIVTGDRALPPSATTIFADGKKLGELGTVLGTRALGLCRIDRVKEMQDNGIPILAGDTALRLAIPPNATFGFPETPSPDEAS